MNNNNTWNKISAVLHGCISYIVFMLIAQTARLALPFWVGSNWALNDEAIIPITYIAYTIAIFYAYYNIIKVLSRYDKQYFVTASGEKKISPWKYTRNIIPNCIFWLEAVPKLFFIIILPTNACYFPLIRLLNYFTITSESLNTTILIKIVIATITFFSEIAIKRKLKPIPIKNKAKYVISNLISIFLGYISFSVGLILALYFLYCTFNALTSNTGLKDILTLLVPIFLFILTYKGIHILRTVIIRRKFFKKLQKTCKNTGAEVQELYRPYFSIFRLGKKQSFILNYKGKLYECQLLSAAKKGNPVYISPEGNMEIKHILIPKFLRLRMLGSHIPYYTTSLNFGWETQKNDSKKVLILSPISKTIFSGNVIRNSYIYIGTSVGDYTVYNGTGFINAIERDCLCTDKK